MAHDAGETCSGAPRGDPREWFLISQTALHGIGEVVRWTLRVLKQLFNRYEQMYRRSLKMTSGGSEYVMNRPMPTCQRATTWQSQDDYTWFGPITHHIIYIYITHALTHTQKRLRHGQNRCVFNAAHRYTRQENETLTSFSFSHGARKVGSQPTRSQNRCCPKRYFTATL